LGWGSCGEVKPREVTSASRSNILSSTSRKAGRSSTESVIRDLPFFVFVCDSKTVELGTEIAQEKSQRTCKSGSVIQDTRRSRFVTALTAKTDLFDPRTKARHSPRKAGLRQSEPSVSSILSVVRLSANSISNLRSAGSP